MSFLFCFFVGLNLYPCIAKKFDFDNFDRFGYYFGFWIPLLLELIKILAGNLYFDSVYQNYFSFPFWLFALVVLTVFYRIYCGTYRESLFILLPAIGLAVNALASFLSSDGSNPFAGLPIEIEAIKFLPGYILFLPFLIFTYFLRKKTQEKYRLSLLGVSMLLLTGFYLFYFLSAGPRIKEKYPDMKLLSLRYSDMVGTRMNFTGRNGDNLYRGTYYFLSEPERVSDPSTEEIKNLISFLSFDKNLSAFFTSYFVNPEIEIEDSLDRTKIHYAETVNTLSPAYVNKAEIVIDRKDGGGSISCSMLVFYRIEIPCVSKIF